MPSNSENMSVEDRLVEHIKSDTVMRAVADDDLLQQLAKRAIEEAFFKSEKLTDGYGRTTSEVRSKATMAADEIADKIASKAVAELWSKEEFKSAVLKAMDEVLPKVLLLAMLKSVYEMGTDLRSVIEGNVVNDLQNRLANSGVTIL